MLGFSFFFPHLRGTWVISPFKLILMVSVKKKGVRRFVPLSCHWYWYTKQAVCSVERSNAWVRWNFADGPFIQKCKEQQFLRSDCKFLGVEKRTYILPTCVAVFKWIQVWTGESLLSCRPLDQKEDKFLFAMPVPSLSYHHSFCSIWIYFLPHGIKIDSDFHGGHIVQPFIFAVSLTKWLSAKLC